MEKKKANKAQAFLLEHNCGDLVLNDHRLPKDWIYVSDIMMKFLKFNQPH